MVLLIQIQGLWVLVELQGTSLGSSFHGYEGKRVTCMATLENEALAKKMGTEGALN